MSQKKVHVCEGCGTTCENSYEVKGWVLISGSIARARGEYGAASFKTDYLSSSGGDHDFCSVGCIEKTLNKCKTSEVEQGK